MSRRSRLRVWYRRAQKSFAAHSEIGSLDPTIAPPVSTLNPPSVARAKCIVCDEEENGTNFPTEKTTAHCQHDVNTCCKCLGQQIEVQFWSDMWNTITCPSCCCRLTPGDVNKFGSKDLVDRYLRIVNPAVSMFDLTFLRYNKLVSAAKIASDDSEHLNHQMNSGEVAVSKARDEASDFWMTINAKACPQCGVLITMNGGCDRMTCCRCRYEFCWICLAGIDGSRKLSHAAHLEDCSHRGTI